MLLWRQTARKAAKINVNICGESRNLTAHSKITATRNGQSNAFVLPIELLTAALFPLFILFVSLLERHESSFGLFYSPVPFLHSILLQPVLQRGLVDEESCILSWGNKKKRRIRGLNRRRALPASSRPTGNQSGSQRDQESACPVCPLSRAIYNEQSWDTLAVSGRLCLDRIQSSNLRRVNEVGSRRNH